MKTPTYKKTEDGKLQIKETREETTEVSLEGLKNRREFYLREIASYEAALTEVDALIAKAVEMGVVEAAGEVEESVV